MVARSFPNWMMPTAPKPVAPANINVPTHGFPAPAPGANAARVTPTAPTTIASHCGRRGHGAPPISGASSIHQNLPIDDISPASAPLETARP